MRRKEKIDGDGEGDGEGGGCGGGVLEEKGHSRNRQRKTAEERGYTLQEREGLQEGKAVTCNSITTSFGWVFNATAGGGGTRRRGPTDEEWLRDFASDIRDLQCDIKRQQLTCVYRDEGRKHRGQKVSFRKRDDDFRASGITGTDSEALKGDINKQVTCVYRDEACKQNQRLHLNYNYMNGSSVINKTSVNNQQRHRDMQGSECSNGRKVYTETNEDTCQSLVNAETGLKTHFQPRYSDQRHRDMQGNECNDEHDIYTKTNEDTRQNIRNAESELESCNASHIKIKVRERNTINCVCRGDSNCSEDSCAHVTNTESNCDNCDTGDKMDLKEFDTDYECKIDPETNLVIGGECGDLNTSVDHQTMHHGRNVLTLDSSFNTSSGSDAESNHNSYTVSSNGTKSNEEFSSIISDISRDSGVYSLDSNYTSLDLETSDKSLLQELGDALGDHHNVTSEPCVHCCGSSPYSSDSKGSENVWMGRFGLEEWRWQEWEEDSVEGSDYDFRNVTERRRVDSASMDSEENAISLSGRDAVKVYRSSDKEHSFQTYKDTDEHTDNSTLIDSEENVKSLLEKVTVNSEKNKSQEYSLETYNFKGTNVDTVSSTLRNSERNSQSERVATVNSDQKTNSENPNISKLSPITQSFQNLSDRVEDLRSGVQCLGSEIRKSRSEFVGLEERGAQLLASTALMRQRMVRVRLLKVLEDRLQDEWWAAYDQNSVSRHENYIV